MMKMGVWIVVTIQNNFVSPCNGWGVAEGNFVSPVTVSQCEGNPCPKGNGSILSLTMLQHGIE
jgi:hypothetical protein